MKRKDFIRNTGGVVLSSMMAPNLMANIGVNSNINLGVIGTGGRGQGIIKLLNTIPNCNVIAVCDTLDFRLAEGFSLIQNNKNAKSYIDFRKLLDDKNIDGVIITTPLHMHDVIAVDALDANKHVYCEKTLAKGTQATARIVKKCRSSNKIFQTGHQYHSSRMYTQLVDMIADGKVGKISAIEAQWNRNGNWRRAVPNSSLERQINWRMYREYSYGLLAELSSHQIDFANWILNATPKRAMGMGGINYWKDGRETYDNTKVVYEYPDGVKATYTCLTSNAKDDYKIMVMGDKGTLTIFYDTAWFYPEGEYEPEYGEVDGVSGATTNWSQSKGTPLNIKHIDPTKQALIDFRDAIINNTPPLSSVITGAKASYAVEMGIQAMDTEKIIHWDKKNFIL
ncbi:MAG: Gfo/Idh/MocA family oxidoreductase [Flavobacteriaceae bacterium]|jgi:predicted dehydrogenase